MRPTPKKLALAIAAIGLLPASAVARQQPAEKPVERLTVTGSNIKRVDSEGPLPVQIITREEIERSAAPTVGDFVRALTVNSGGSGSDSDVNNQSGAAGVSLRGLGQKSTLVLLNGRRMANHAFARDRQDTFVDMNSIPKGAIERIEVLKDGASAIYGSDAIAGVINFILRKDYQGATLAASGGTSTEGGLDERTVNVSAGFGDLYTQKFNVFAVFDYYHRERLLLSERKWLGDGDLTRLGGGNLFLSSSAGTWVSVAPQTAFSPTSLALQPAGVPGGVRRQAFLNCLGNGFRQTVVPFAPLVFSTGTVCAHTTTPFITAYPEADRMGFMSRANFALAGGSSAFVELALAQNKSEWINQPQTMTNVTQVFDPVTQGSRLYNVLIPATNPSNPFGQAYRLRYTFFDVGAREHNLKTDVYRALAGLSGTSGRWDWEVAIGKSESKIREDVRNQVDADALTAAIANATYNFLAPTPSQTAALRVSTQRNSTSKLDFGDVKASTTIGKMEGGDIGLALGLDARRESINDTPDPLVRSGRLLGTGSSITSGSRDVVAAFAEFSLPVTKQFEMQLALRGDRYSDFGSSTSPKVGLKYSPSNEWLLRGSFSKGFRAPTLPENTQSTSLSFATLTGSPGGVSVIFTGNPNLKAERSESVTLGVVFEPIKTLSIGLDWYRINQKDLVAANGISFIAQNPTLFPNDIIRDGTGAITAIFDRYSNVASVKVEGVDLDARWQLPRGWMPGKLTLRGNASYLASFKQPPAIGQASVEYAGSNAGPRGALPRVKSRFTLDWDLAGFAASLSHNWNSKYAQKRTATFPSTQTHVSDQHTIDLSLSYTGIKNLKLIASVLNLEDKQPPFDAGTFGWDTTQYDLRGRYVRIGAEYKFR